MHDHSNYSKRLPIKLAEISIKKFNQNGIPHHLGLLRNHKTNIEKCLALGDWDKIKKEEINATRVIKQLKNLLMEMDELRNKIQPEDISKFDDQIAESRQMALDEINTYLKITLKSPSSSQKSSTTLRSPYDDDDINQETRLNEVEHELQIDNIQIQTNFNLSEHQLRQREACLIELENLHREIEDLHGIFNRLNDTVAIQGETVEVAAKNVETAQIQVEQGESSLRQALKYKKAMYPMCGAIIGTCIGGPIGLFAGLKVGGMAAIGCGILGFTGGAAIKNKENSDVNILERNEASEATERKNE